MLSYRRIARLYFVAMALPMSRTVNGILLDLIGRKRDFFKPTWDFILL